MGRVRKNINVWIKRSVLFSQKGATAVEFAIVFPLLILLLFAMVEFGLFLFNRQVITNACREGARAGIVARPERMSNAEIEQKVREFSEQHLVTFGSDDTLTVHLKTPFPASTDEDLPDPDTQRCQAFSCELEVRADFTYEFLFLSTIGIGAKQIQGLAKMRME